MKSIFSKSAPQLLDLLSNYSVIMGRLTAGGAVTDVILHAVSLTLSAVMLRGGASTEACPLSAASPTGSTAGQGSKLRPFWSQMRLKLNQCDLKIYLGAPVRLSITAEVRLRHAEWKPSLPFRLSCNLQSLLAVSVASVSFNCCNNATERRLSSTVCRHVRL